MSDELKKIIPAYRAGETQPLKLDVATIMRMSKATGEGLKLGMPEIGAKQLVNKMLLEGREDAGTNGYNFNNPRAHALYDSLVDAGIGRRAAEYPAAVLDKSEVAKRLGIPFELAWNGTGKTKEADGQRHAARSEKFKNADKDPRNAGLVDLVTRSMNGQNTSQENLLSMSNERVLGVLTGVNEPVDYSGESPRLKDKPMNEVEDRITQTMKSLKFSPEQMKKVGETLATKYGYNEAAWLLPEIYKSVSGVEPNRPAYVKEIMAQPETKAVFDTILGVDPGGEKYLASKGVKQTSPATSETGGFLASLKSIFN